MKIVNKKIEKVIETGRDLMFAAEEYIWANPETGYREWKTTAYLENEFEKLGYHLIKAGNVPGFYTDIDTGIKGPMILLMGELDSVLCSTHPESDKETGAVHACGHHAQCAALLGAAHALSKSEVLEGLVGKIRLMAVPAEELLELDFRSGLRKQGIIKYLGGKVEFMRRGYMDNVDVALMLHTGGGDKSTFFLPLGMNGCVTKSINYKGRAAHAGGSPHLGINALYAANLGMQAINSIRETFKEKDYIRVHPIITKGGVAVNVIPEDVKIESYVRGSNVKAIKEENEKVNRALVGAAASMGASIEIEDMPGYMPVDNDKNLYKSMYDLMVELVGESNVIKGDLWETGCTDMGDMSCVIPAIHPSVSGAQGIGHGANYKIMDKEDACVLAAKFLVGSAITLLSDNGKNAKYIIENKKLQFDSYDDYYRAVDDFFLLKEGVVYNDDGTITLDYR